MSAGGDWSATELVRISRLVDGKTLDPCEGVVVAASPALMAVFNVDDRGLTDGFSLNRRSDVRTVERLADADFYAEVLRLRGTPPPEWPDLDLRSMAAALEGLRRAGEMVIVRLEAEDPEVLDLGHVAEVREADGTFSLWGLAPGGQRDEEPDTWSFEECTQIDFGGEYVRSYALYDAAHQGA